MDAVILTDNHAGFPRELLARRPPALFPLGGSTVAEVLLERLARAKVRRAVFVLSGAPYLMERRLGRGERFGLDLRHVLRKAFTGVREGLSKALPLLGETFLVFDRLLATDVDLADVWTAHRAAGRGLTVCLPEPTAPGAPAAPFFVLDRSRVADIPPDIYNLAHWAAALPPEKAHVLRSRGSALAVDGMAAYARAMTASLAGLPPFEGRGGTIVVGRRCKIHPTVRLTPPARIGDCTSIGRECVVGPLAFIGEGCVVDARSEIVRSTVFEGGYVGREVTLDGRVVDHDLLVNPKNGTVIRAPDSFLLGDAAGRGLTEAASRLFQRLLALAALIAASPVLLAVLAVPAWRKRLIRREAAGEYVQRDLRGDKTPRRFFLRELDVDHHVLRRLPALWDVVAGRLNLVGVEPMALEEAEKWRGSWADDRFKRPPGLVTPWRAMTAVEPESDEKRVMENYYVQTWSFREDLRILVKSLLFRPRA